MSFANVTRHQSPSGEQVEPDSAPDAVSLEFNETWESTSDLNEDDLEAIREDNARGWSAPPPPSALHSNA